VIKNVDNGMLVDFFSPDAVAKTVNTVLENPLDMRSLRARARATVLERYTIEHGILGYCGLINEVINAGPRVQD
jgi:glycosyltransferase involved in cell wall biosynthesis